MQKLSQELELRLSTETPAGLNYNITLLEE